MFENVTGKYLIYAILDVYSLQIAQKLALLHEDHHAAVLTLRRTMEVMKMEGDLMASLSAHARRPMLDGAATYVPILTASPNLVRRGHDPQA